jgi:hypothetical protein
MRRVFHPETNGVKASPHGHKRVLSHGAPADPSDPWNIHAAPVSPLQQFNTTSDFWYRQGASARISPFKCWVARLWNLHENSYPMHLDRFWERDREHG